MRLVLSPREGHDDDTHVNINSNPYSVSDWLLLGVDFCAGVTTNQKR